MKNLRNNLKWAAETGKQTFAEAISVATPRLGAALAFYTVFAITPLFLIVLRIAGIWFGAEAAKHELFGQLQGLLGAQGGKAIEAAVTAASDQPKAGAFASGLAAVTLLTAATGVFVELQDSLNVIWRVKPSGKSGVWIFIRGRLLSFAMILGTGFLLLVSLVFSAGLSAVGNFASGAFAATRMFWSATNFLVSLAVITVLFTMIFKILPEVRLEWRDVWLGGFITALLFNLGKILLGLYLGRTSVASAYGAAGSLVVILLWVYYSAQIMFFGAVFTRVYSLRRREGQLKRKGG